MDTLAEQIRKQIVDLERACGCGCCEDTDAIAAAWDTLDALLPRIPTTTE